MLFSVSTVLCGGCFVVVPFPCFAKVLLCWNLSTSCANRFNTELSASLTSMLSASRQIATRRLSCLLACFRKCRLRHFPAETAQVSISNLHGMFCSDKTGTTTENIATIESEFHNVRFRTECCRLHCWLQSASGREDVMFTMLFKCKLEVHAVSTATRLIYSLLDLAVKATESIVETYCHNHKYITADVVLKVSRRSCTKISTPSILAT